MGFEPKRLSSSVLETDPLDHFVALRSGAAWERCEAVPYRFVPVRGHFYSKMVKEKGVETKEGSDIFIVCLELTRRMLHNEWP